MLCCVVFVVSVVVGVFVADSSRLGGVGRIVRKSCVMVPVRAKCVGPGSGLSIVVGPTRGLVGSSSCLIVTRAPVSITRNELVSRSGCSPSLATGFLAAM